MSSALASIAWPESPSGADRSWSYQNDILGNRTGRNKDANNSSAAMTHTWDVLGRASIIAGNTTGAGYFYRADGQRVEKVEGVTYQWVADTNGGRASGHYDTNYASNRPTTRFFYDGTMGVEDDYNPSGTITTVNRYALGARGIERIENYASSTYTYGYPIYDGHGNMRATLSKDGSGGYTTSNWRSYDVWGSIRSGATGGPTQRYSANLGHVADDETGLIYMRARYMEPASGRFVSQDPAYDGRSWFSYCQGDPVNFQDESGQYSDFSQAVFVIAGSLSFLSFIAAMAGRLVMALNVAQLSVFCFALGLGANLLFGDGDGGALWVTAGSANGFLMELDFLLKLRSNILGHLHG